MTLDFLQLPLLFLISYLSHRLLHKFKFPASRLVGPILAVASLQVLGFAFSVPTPFKTVFSIVFGIFLGLRFNKAALIRLKAAALPAILISILYIGITMLYGELLTAVSVMDQTTAFLSVIPGGVAEASVLAVSYNANLAQVSSFQLTRFLSIVVIVPLFANWALKSKNVIKKDPTLQPIEAPEDSDPIEYKEKKDAHHWLWLFLIGALGSFVFYKIHFPAALLIGATFTVSASLMLSKKEFHAPSQQFYNFAQIGMGAVIGTSFTSESLQVISTLIGPMVLLTVLILTTSILLGLLFSKLFKWDFMTGFMSVLPGGMSAMVVLADEFDADVVTISTLQLVRLLTAVLIIPTLYQIIL
jgi:hypothetical protein